MIRFATVLSRQIVGIFIVVYAVAFWRSASALPAGPAVTYPRLVIGALLALVLVEFLVGGRRAVQETDPKEGPDAVATRSTGEQVTALWAEHRKTFLTTVASGIYIFTIEPLGFYIATAIYLGFLLPYLGVRRPAHLIPLWVGALLITWGLFDVMLSVRLPEGLLG